MRCRPGDIAVVITGSNTGAFVDVIERSPDHPTTHEPAWVCRIMASMRVTHVDMRRRRVIGEWPVPPGSLVMFCDAVLQPIRPPPIPQDKTTELELSQ